MSQTPPAALTKQFEIINLEGTVLALYAEIQNPEKLYLSSFLPKQGEVFYATNKSLLKRFLASEITINELFNLSESDIVLVKHRGKSMNYLKSTFALTIFEGDKKYNDFPDHSKSKSFEESFR